LTSASTVERERSMVSSASGWALSCLATGFGKNLLPSTSVTSKNGAPVNRFLYLKVYFTLTLSVPITEATEVATLTPKTIARAGAAFRGAAEGKDGSLRGVSYCSRNINVDPGA